MIDEATHQATRRLPTRYARLITLTKRNLARATEPALRERLQQTINGLEARQAMPMRVDRTGHRRRFDAKRPSFAPHGGSGDVGE